MYKKTLTTLNFINSALPARGTFVLFKEHFTAKENYTEWK